MPRMCLRWGPLSDRTSCQVIGSGQRDLAPTDHSADQQFTPDAELRDMSTCSADRPETRGGCEMSVWATCVSCVCPCVCVCV